MEVLEELARTGLCVAILFLVACSYYTLHDMIVGPERRYEERLKRWVKKVASEVSAGRAS